MATETADRNVRVAHHHRKPIVIVDCQHFDNGTCRLASDIAGLRVPASKESCGVCAAQREPKTINPVTVSLAIYYLRRAGRYADERNVRQRYQGVIQRAAPSGARRAWNLAKAVAAFAADRFRTISHDRYAARLAICDECERRQDSVCLECGCYLPAKARARAWTCPLGKWPAEETADTGSDS